MIFFPLMLQQADLIRTDYGSAFPFLILKGFIHVYGTFHVCFFKQIYFYGNLISLKQLSLK